MAIAYVIIISSVAGLVVWLTVLALGLGPAAAALIATLACVLCSVALAEMWVGDDGR